MFIYTAGKKTRCDSKLKRSSCFSTVAWCEVTNSWSSLTGPALQTEEVYRLNYFHVLLHFKPELSLLSIRWRAGGSLCCNTEVKGDRSRWPTIAADRVLFLPAKLETTGWANELIISAIYSASAGVAPCWHWHRMKVDNTGCDVSGLAWGWIYNKTKCQKMRLIVF